MSNIKDASESYHPDAFVSKQVCFCLLTENFCTKALQTYFSGESGAPLALATSIRNVLPVSASSICGHSRCPHCPSTTKTILL